MKNIGIYLCMWHMYTDRKPETDIQISIKVIRNQNDFVVSLPLIESLFIFLLLYFCPFFFSENLFSVKDTFVS